MPLAVPPELKKITPFIRRAEELDRDHSSPESRLVAYYCRQYAVHTGIPLAGASPGAKTCLGHILENLEKEKPAMDNFTREEASFLCRKFANNVFDKADGEDRMGMASKNTAKTFYAAASFLQILEQFSDGADPAAQEDKKKIIYAKWKSTEILKAIKEGRTPKPGGYGEEEPEELSEEEENTPGQGVEVSAPTKVDAPPSVENVTESDSEVEEEAKLPATFSMPTAPAATFPTQPPKIEPEEKEPEDNHDDAEREEGMEVELGPPPAYPGGFGGQTSRVDKPKLTFDLPPPMEVKPLPKPAASPPAKKTGIFGFGKKKPEKVTKTQIADATELTKFALAALEDKEVDLAAERLAQALQALGR